MAFLLDQLDNAVVVTAIPAMARHLDATPIQMNVVVTAYVITVAALLPCSGWLADRFGARRVLLLAITVFMAGSALCGVAQSLSTLLMMRMFQGVGGAMMVPVARLVLLRSFPRSEFVTAMRYLAIPVLVGPVVGPLLAGYLVTYVSWRAIFFVTLPFGVLGILLIRRFTEPDRTFLSKPFDAPGFLMLGGSVGLLQFILNEAGTSSVDSWVTLLLSACCIALVAALVRHTRKVAEPVVDFALFKARSFSVSTLIGGLCRIGLNAPMFLLPLMLQVGFRMSAVDSGSLTFIASAASLFVQIIIGWLLRTLGFRTVLVGSSLAAFAIIASFALIEADLPRWIISSQIFVFGTIRVIQFQSTNTLAYADIPDQKLSRATTLGGIVHQLTMSLGVSIGATLLSLLSRGGSTLTPQHFHESLLALAMLPLFAAGGFMQLGRAAGVHVSGHRRSLPASSDASSKSST